MSTHHVSARMPTFISSLPESSAHRRKSSIKMPHENLAAASKHLAALAEVFRGGVWTDKSTGLAVTGSMSESDESV